MLTMNDTTWLTTEQQSAWRKLVAVVELLPGALESQLQGDADLRHFEYFALAMLSEAPEHTLRLTGLATLTNSTLPRLSHVISRLERRGLVRREPCPEDKRATNAVLTEDGLAVVERAAPGHVENVRRTVFEPLAADDVADLDRIMGRILTALDPDGAVHQR
jgi:DNA-binding MarR family transcriptional regulator